MKPLQRLSVFCNRTAGGGIAQGLNTVGVLVQQPPVKHEVKMKDFLS
jgi:hypothetical protein